MQCSSFNGLLCLRRSYRAAQLSSAAHSETAPRVQWEAPAQQYGWPQEDAQQAQQATERSLNGSSVFSAPSSSYSNAPQQAAGTPGGFVEPTTPVQAPALYRPPSRPNAYRPNLGPPVAGAAPTGSSQPSSSAQQPNLVVLCRSVRCTHTCSVPDGLADALPLLQVRPLPCSTCCTAHHTL